MGSREQYVRSKLDRALRSSAKSKFFDYDEKAERKRIAEEARKLKATEGNSFVIKQRDQLLDNAMCVIRNEASKGGNSITMELPSHFAFEIIQAIQEELKILGFKCEIQNPESGLIDFLKEEKFRLSSKLTIKW